MVGCMLTFSQSLFPCPNVMSEISKLIFFTNYKSKHWYYIVFLQGIFCDIIFFLPIIKRLLFIKLYSCEAFGANLEILFWWLQKRDEAKKV